MIDHTEQAKIEYELDRILADEKFSAAPQMSAFLRYVVKQTLDGNSERIKAYTVAVDALGKPPTFDPQNDPSVRVLAKRLRSSIEQYYERTSGHEVIIEMTRGSYIPKFVPAGTDADAQSDDDDAGAAGNAGGMGNVASASVPESISTSDTAADASANPVEAESVSETDADAHIGDGVTERTAGSASTQADTAPQRAAGAVPPQPTRTTTPPPAPRMNFPSSPREWLARGKLPRSLAFVGIAAMSLWYVQQSGQPDAEDVAAADSQQNVQQEGDLRIALASDTRVQPMKARPATPTISVLIDSTSHSLESRLGAHMASVISHFDNVQALRDSGQIPGVPNFWPEEYALTLSKLNIDDRLSVSVQLLHRSTGRIVHADTLLLNKTADTSLSSAEMIELDEFTARLVQPNGPLMRDYKALGNMAGLMSCVFAVRSSDDGGNPCPEALSTEPLLKGRALALQAEQQLKVATSLNGKARSDAVGNAVKLAREAVKRSPYSANAHAVLMSGLAYQGDRKAALDAANRALELNPFDGDILRAAAKLVQSTDRKQANELVERARRLDDVQNT